MRPRLRSLLQLVALFLLNFAFNISCARQTTFFVDPKNETATVVPISTDGRGFLPKDFYDQSVGRARTDTQLDLLTATSKSLRLQTQAGTNPPGNFNAAGTGNRALLGLGTWSNRALSKLTRLEWEARVLEGPRSIGAILQVDMNCDGTDLRAYEAKPETLLLVLPASVPLANGYTETRILSTDAVWTQMKPSPGSPVSIDSLLSTSPSACLKNAVASADGLPKGIPVASVLFSLGDENFSSAAAVFVRRLVIGAEIYEDLQ